MYVYVHTNKINGKKYYGVTKNYHNRWRNEGIAYKNYKGNQSIFWLDIQKYGWDSFDHEILYNDVSEDEAYEIEKNLISQSKRGIDIYNIGAGWVGGINYIDNNHPKGFLGYKHTDETKSIISDKMKGENNPFYNKKHEIHPKGFKYKQHSAQSKQKTSNTMKDKKINCKKVSLVKEDGTIHVFDSYNDCCEFIGLKQESPVFRNMIKTGDSYKETVSTKHYKHLIELVGCRLIKGEYRDN